MYKCENLQKPNFNVKPKLKRSNLKTVGDDWMANCAKLETPNFDGLSTLETVGNGWMSNCKNLTTPNFSGLSSLTTIGVGWMSNCKNLTTPTLVYQKSKKNL